MVKKIQLPYEWYEQRGWKLVTEVQEGGTFWL